MEPEAAATGSSAKSEFSVEPGAAATGSLPGNFITGAFTFYFNLVIACVLGLSLFKCADRLGINAE